MARKPLETPEQCIFTGQKTIPLDLPRLSHSPGPKPCILKRQPTGVPRKCSAKPLARDLWELNAWQRTVISSLPLPIRAICCPYPGFFCWRLRGHSLLVKTGNSATDLCHYGSLWFFFPSMLAIIANILNAYRGIIILHSSAALILVTVLEIVICIIPCLWMKWMRLERWRNLPKDLQGGKEVAELELEACISRTCLQNHDGS